jgi:hypothetical protein
LRFESSVISYGLDGAGESGFFTLLNVQGGFGLLKDNGVVMAVCEFELQGRKACACVTRNTIFVDIVGAWRIV